MLSDYFGCVQSPIEITHNVNNYTKDGLIIWGNLHFKKMIFVKRAHLFNAAECELYMKEPNKAVLLEVNNGQHWVVGIRKTLFGNDYIVADPWTGRKVAAKKVYHNITGASFFARN